jgi:hypothetical protein
MTTKELTDRMANHFNYIAKQLNEGKYQDAVKSSELFTTWFKVKVTEIGEVKEEKNGQT